MKWGGVDRIEMVCHVLRPKGLTKSEVFTTGKQLELFKPIQTYNMQCDHQKRFFSKNVNQKSILLSPGQIQIQIF